MDGFDIERNRTPSTLYIDLAPTVNRMRDKGYDVLLVDYADGQEFIQRNALALMEILKNIPIQKPWLKMAPGYENQKAIVIAGSMGTQVARYALAKLEEQNMDHHTGLWIAIDGPFVGANVPVSMQGLFSWTARVDSAGEPSKRAINSPAAKEMLRRFYGSGNGTLSYPHYYHENFYNEVRALNGGTGMPQKLRKVAMAQGSGQALTQEQKSRTADDLIAKFEYLETITIGNLWYGADINAYAEEKEEARVRILDAWVTKPLCVCFPVLFPPWLLPIGRSLYLSYEYEISEGQQELDMLPGGSSFGPRKYMKAWNADAQEEVRGITSELENFAFIPLFSALGYEGAGDGATTEPVSTWYEISSGWIKELESWSSGELRTLPSDLWYAPEDPSRFPLMDPNIEAITPFDAIWYEPDNVEHLFTTGVRPKVASEAFLFNEMDTFTSQEAFSEKTFDPSPKMPTSEMFLSDFTYESCGEIEPGVVICGDAGGSNLFAINTMTKKAMIQDFEGATGTWSLVWDSGTTGRIGDWVIDKGDKFYLMPRIGVLQLAGLLSISADTPARAMIQTLQLGPGAGEVNWTTVWSNNGSGLLGSVTIRPTNLYIFGNVTGAGDNELLALYPYIGNNARERYTPGAGGRSIAQVLRFNETINDWEGVWQNIGGPGSGVRNFIGSLFDWPIRFGDHLDFLKTSTSTGESDTLLGIIQLPNVFCCPFFNEFGGSGYFDGPSAVLQKFNPLQAYSWEGIWNNTLNSTPRPFWIGSWAYGGAEDAYDSGDIDGDGIDELVSYGPPYLHVQNFTPGCSPAPNCYDDTWTLKYFAQPPGGGGPTLFGNYEMRSGDRFFVGNFDVSSDPPEEILSLNPDEQHRAMIQKYNPANPTQWDIVWDDTATPGYLGSWKLYER